MFVINPGGSPAAKATAVLWDDEPSWIIYLNNDGVGRHDIVAAMAWVEATSKESVKSEPSLAYWA